MAYVPKTKVVKFEEKPADRLNLIDRAITFFSPQYGIQAMVAREQLHRFGYNDKEERRSKPKPLSGSETWAANRDRWKMMADAREAATYDWIGGVLAKVVLYVCGKIHCKSESGEDEISELYDDYFHAWCGDEPDEDGMMRCDMSGRHRFVKQVQMAFLAFLVDGDHGLLEVAPEFSPTAQVDEAGLWVPGTGGFCLQNIEADRIGKPDDIDTGDHYIGGVILDPRSSRIQAYRTYRRTRMNTYVDQQDVPAGSFIHVFDPDKSDEYRGRTKLLRLLNDLRDIREWIEAEKIAGKTQSQWAALIGTRDPYNNQGAGAWEGKTAEGTPTQDAQWGKMLKLAEGENFSMLSPSARPSGAFMAFVQMLIRKMSASLNLPYGFLWDLASLGGVTARIEVQGALRQIQYWQENVLINRILNRVRQKVLAEGIALGHLPPHPNWRKCSWHFGPWITTDAGYEMQADVQGVQAGIIPIEDITAKYGKSAKEVFRSNAETANMAIGVGAENELPVETFAKGIFPNITQEKAAYLQPTPTPPPKPGSIEAIGDKGVKLVIETCQSVGDGTLDRDSGINILVNTVGIPRGVADKMVPEEPSEEDKNREAGLSPDGKFPPPAPAAKTSSSKKPSKPATKKK